MKQKTLKQIGDIGIENFELDLKSRVDIQHLLRESSSSVSRPIAPSSIVHLVGERINSRAQSQIVPS